MSLLKSLFEATKTKTDQKTKVDFGLGPDLSPPKSKGYVAPVQQKAEPQSQPKMKSASGAKTRDKMSGVQMDPMSFQHFANMDTSTLDMSNEISDEEAARNAGVDSPEAPGLPNLDVTPRIPSMLPAVISKAMIKSGTDVGVQNPNDIEWHMVKNLPGYMAAPIRAIGRQVFSPFTKTKIEDIQVLANLQGHGPNSEEELNAITRFVMNRGQKNMDAELHFQQIFPGYGAEIVSFDAEGFTFLFVKDFAGQYIYSWPTADSKSVGGTASSGNVEGPKTGRIAGPAPARLGGPKQRR